MCEQAQRAQVIVVNHTLLLLDAVTEGAILPNREVIVLDEAHHLEDEATRAFSRAVAYSHKASREQILTLLYAGRIKGLPHKGKGVYLIHRDGLVDIEDRPKRGWPKKDKKRPRKGRQTGEGAPERVNQTCEKSRAHAGISSKAPR